jgi:O-acetyl-ADP-ribose deacetylase (regulator of RNase III)
MIKVIRGDLTKQNVDAIVNPANSDMLMGGGVALAIKRKGGEEIEREAMKCAPVLVGEAVLTSAGGLPAKFVIHAPTMETPGQTDEDKVRLATKAALECATSNNFSSIAFPGMGTGVGKVPPKEAAEAMLQAIKESGKYMDGIYLVALNAGLYKAFERALK